MILRQHLKLQEDLGLLFQMKKNGAKNDDQIILIIINHDE